MKRILALLLSACLALSVGACAQPAPPEPVQSAPASPEEPSGRGEDAYPLTFRDSLGNEITLPQPPERVAVLLGSYAESWVLAGGEENLAAVTDDAFEERRLELSGEVVNLGSSKQPDLEALFAARPELVLLTPDLEGQLALAESLEAAGIPAAWFKVETFPEYLDMLKILTDITGRPDLYQKNGLDVQAQVDAALARAPEQGPAVLLLRAYSTGVRAKNSDNTAGAMLWDLGCRNIADSDAGLLEELQMEAILAAGPEYIFVTTMGSSTEKALKSLEELFDSDPAWQSLTAVKEDRVHVLDKELFHYKPNARWGESYEVLADILYPVS